MPACGAIGNIGMNVYHGPGGFYSDLSVSKAFGITERVRARFVTDFFNIFNHPVYAFSAIQRSQRLRGLPGRYQRARSPGSKAVRACGRSSSPCGSSSKNLQAL